jgi:Ni/Co efflux regulator RcnB
MKRLLVLTMVLAVLAFTAMPAAADRGSGGNNGGERVSQQGGDQQQHRQEDRQQNGEQERSRDGNSDQEQEREQERLHDGDSEQRQYRYQKREQRFDLEGRIIAINEANGLITVATGEPGKAGEAYMRQVRVQVSAGTLMQLRSGLTQGMARMNELQTGQPVLIHGTTDGAVRTALRIWAAR